MVSLLGIPLPDVLLHRMVSRSDSIGLLETDDVTDGFGQAVFDPGVVRVASFLFHEVVDSDIQAKLLVGFGEILLESVAVPVDLAVDFPDSFDGGFHLSGDLFLRCHKFSSLLIG